MANRVEGLSFVFWEDAFSLGALGNLSGAPTPDQTISQPTSIAVAPSVTSRNSGSSSSSSLSSSSGEGYLMKSAILSLSLTICLALVTRRMRRREVDTDGRMDGHQGRSDG